jgi:hypothetical protein
MLSKPLAARLANPFVPMLLAAAAWLVAGPAAAISFNHDLPATGIPSLNPPYPNVATLTLTQTGDGVQFVLDPNEGSPGFGGSSFVERLDFVYAGAALTDGDFRNDAGIPGDFSFESNPNNMDAGYKADVFHIVVDFPSNPPDRFTPTDTSTWTVLGASLADFATFATANNKPSPIFSVISVTAYSLPDVKPTPSNWVTVIPEPNTAALVLLGVAALRGVAQRRQHRDS